MEENYDKSDLTIANNSFPDAITKEGLIKPCFNGHVIIWFKEGKGSYFIDFKEYELRPNTIILISKDQDTSFEFLDDDPQFDVINFTQDFVNTSDGKIQQLFSFCIKEHFEGKQIFNIGVEDAIYLEMIIRQLKSICDNWNGQLKQDSIFHFLQLFLTYCNQLKDEQSQEDISDFRTAMVGDFTTLLEKNFRNTHKVNYYIENLNLTYNSLSRYTTNYCGRTPKEIIIERVILEVKRLLSGTRMPIKEIAYQLGFDEPTNLVKYFKKNTGITPTAFRTHR